jgi:MoxR-like ATPase
VLVHDGRAYDSKAIAGAAYKHQFPKRRRLTNADFSGGVGLGDAVDKLRSLDFVVKETNLSAPLITALRQIQQGVRTYRTPSGIHGQDLEGLRSRGLIRVDDGGQASLTPDGDAKLAELFDEESGPRVWLFQANPKYYDIDSAIRQLASMNWTVSHHVEQIRPGDRVYVWKSGPSGGLVGVGTILTAPELAADQEGEPFIRDPEKFAGEQVRVRMSIDRVVSPPLYRIELKDHPVLGGLGVIQFPRATTYPVTAEQDAAIQKMIGDEMDLAARIAQWREETGYPTDKDIERRAQREELAAALSAENLDAVIEDPERFEVLQFGLFAHNAYGGPGPQSSVHSHLNTGSDAKRRLAQAMKHLIYDTDEAEAGRLDDVLLSDEWHAPGFKESLATKALAVVYPDRWLPLFQTEGSMGKRVLMKAPELQLTEPADLEDLTVGEKIKWANDALRAVLDPYLGDDPWAQGQFLYWLRDKHAETGPPASSTIAELADELYVDQDWLTEVIDLLSEKRQIIFQGPPGTGKTFVARRLAKHFEERGGGSEIVQFHPSYAYEDFVEGYRPRLVNNQPGFELVDGPLKRLARRALADKEHVYVLVIDELNRGNVAKVFGELYYLLEYRDDRIRLQYGDEAGETEGEDSTFGLPRNLWIIATMNTADRSIALMDAALRRRFYFIDYYPDRPPVASLLERWLKAHELWDKFAYLPAILSEANRRLADPQAAIGPSYFLPKDPQRLTEKWVQRIWDHAVLPYLEEQLMGEPERRKEFQLSVLRQAIEAPPGEEAAATTDDADDTSETTEASAAQPT